MCAFDSWLILPFEDRVKPTNLIPIRGLVTGLRLALHRDRACQARLRLRNAFAGRLEKDSRTMKRFGSLVWKRRASNLRFRRILMVVSMKTIQPFGHIE